MLLKLENGQSHMCLQLLPSLCGQLAFVNL